MLLGRWRFALGPAELSRLFGGDEITSTGTDSLLLWRGWGGLLTLRLLRGLFLGLGSNRESGLRRLGGRVLCPQRLLVGRVVIDGLLTLVLHAGGRIHHLQRLLLDMLRPVTLAQGGLVLGIVAIVFAHHSLDLGDGVGLAREVALTILVRVMVGEVVADDTEGEGAPVLGLTLLFLLLLPLGDLGGTVELGDGEVGEGLESARFLG